MRRVHLRTRLLVPFGVAGIVIGSAFLLSVHQERNQHIHHDFEQTVRQVESGYRQMLEQRSAKLGTALDAIVDNPGLQAAMAAGDRARLLQLAEPLFERLRLRYEITHFYFHDPRRFNFLRVHQPARYGDLIDRYTALRAERSGQPEWGVELGPLGTFTLRMVLPWRQGQQLLGYVELGEEIESAISDVARQFGVGLSVVIDKHYLERKDWESGMAMLGRNAEWGHYAQVVVPFQTGELPAEAVESLLHGKAMHFGPHGEKVELDGRTYRIGSFPLLDAGSRTIGTMLVACDISDEVAGTFHLLRPMAAIFLVVGLIWTAGFFLALRYTERQLRVWQQMLEQEGRERELIQKQHIEELERSALYDQLTGLPNRKLLHDRIDHTVGLARRSGEPFALLLVDLHRLKEINDTLGHDMGDEVIRQIAGRLQEGLRESDTVARAAGESYALLMPGIGMRSAILAAEKVRGLLEEPLQVDGVNLDVSASIGIALYPEHGDTAATLVRKADVAMRHAKGKRIPYAIYASDNDPYSIERLTLFGELRQAINEGQLRLYYQPQIDLATRRVLGAEALVRWEHPERGLVSPGEFIPLAEQTGLMGPLTRWVIEAGLRQLSLWREAGVELRLSLNLSTNNLLDHDLPQQLSELFERWEVDTSEVVLEITESAFMHDPEHSLKILSQLKDMRLTLAIDDFGTGYSSLAYLKRLPIKELKIDRSFVTDMLTDPSDATIVHSTINLAHNLGFEVVAEGVEDEATLERLAEYGCDAVQGFLYSRPLAVEAFEAWLKEWEGKGRSG